MKRSKKLSLVLMGSLLTTGMFLTGCEEEQEVQVFKNTQECVQGGFTEEQCLKLEADAKANTPKFTKREECEEQFGKEMCSGGKDSSGDFFMPALMGFMVGNMLGSNSGSTTVINQIPSKEDKDRFVGGGGYVPKNAGSGGAVPFVANGLYNNPENPGTYQSATGRSVHQNSVGKAMVPKSTATFRGGFSGGARVSFGG